MPDEDGYPTDEELKLIEEWPVADFIGLIDFVKGIWWRPDWGIGHEKDYSYVSMATGGWSGNESIIGAMERNWMMWSAFWFRSTRGGLYEFNIEMVRGGDLEPKKKEKKDAGHNDV